jgi:hypothetical protein
MARFQQWRRLHGGFLAKMNETVFDWELAGRQIRERGAGAQGSLLEDR